MRHRFSLLAVLVLAGCGGSSGAATTSGHTTDVSLALDWYPNADHVGIYTAIDHGFFRRAGLNVTPHAPSDVSDPIRLVAAGTTDLGIDYEPELFYAQQEHVPVVAVASVAPEALSSIIASARAGSRRRPACAARRSASTARAAPPRSSTPSCALRRRPVRRSPREHPLQPGARPAPAPRRRGGRRVPEHRGHPVRQRGAAPGRVPVRPLRRPRLRRAGHRRERRQAPRRPRLPREVSRFVTSLGAATAWARAHPAAGNAMLGHTYRDYHGTIAQASPRRSSCCAPGRSTPRPGSVRRLDVPLRPAEASRTPRPWSHIPRLRRVAEPSLKGKLLIAAPPLVDPNFHRTVVLVIEHSDEGALGVVLNRPTELPAGRGGARAAADLDEVFAGGPVQPQAVIALAEYNGPPEDAAAGRSRPSACE